uniref:Uncharacterized protein n=1 Tax=Solanum lycopersicum TaxID=4081 RepID=K4AW49_SOLLC
MDGRAQVESCYMDTVLCLVDASPSLERIVWESPCLEWKECFAKESCGAVKGCLLRFLTLQVSTYLWNRGSFLILRCQGDQRRLQVEATDALIIQLTPCCLSVLDVMLQKQGFWSISKGKVEEIQSLFYLEGAEQSKNEPNQMIVLEWLFLTIAPCDAAEPWTRRIAAPREILLYTSSQTRFLNRTLIGERCKNREVRSNLKVPSVLGVDEPRLV